MIDPKLGRIPLRQARSGGVEHGIGLIINSARATEVKEKPKNHG